MQVGTKLAVAAVSIPHVLGTALRFWLMGRHVDRRILWSFGLTSAAEGLFGALLHTRASSPALTLVFAMLLAFAGLMGLTGLASRIQFRGAAPWLAGALSGTFGGLVGNQGGIRSAAMLGFDVPRDAFIGTATAIALFVDAARVPVYAYTEADGIVRNSVPVTAAALGVLIGTLIGGRVLRRIPEPIFRRAISSIILALGLYMFSQVGR